MKSLSRNPERRLAPHRSMRRGSMRRGRALAVMLLAMPCQAARAGDLMEALGQAYATNPDIQEARAQLRSVDEGVQIARAPGLPSLAAAVKYSHYLDVGINNYAAPTRQLTVDGNASLPIYQGGGIRNGIHAARERVVGGRFDLEAVEENVFAQVVAAYLDVIRDEAIAHLNERNVAALEINLQATSARFTHGELTRTDVAQSGERLNLARGQLQSARVTLIASRERYVQLVGKAPGVLAPPPPLAGLPASAEEAVAVALDGNPDLLSARQKVKAAGYDVKVAGASRLPNLSVVGTVEYDNYFDTMGGPFKPFYSQHDRISVIGVNLSVPLFQGGLPAAEQRQAQAKESAALEHVNSVERQIIQVARAAYSAWKATDEIIAANARAVEAANQSLVGVRAENKIGDRTILDVLNAEQELLNAQVQLVSARHDSYVSAFNLLVAMGKARAQDLGFDESQIYDPNANFHRVSGRIWDWDKNPRPVSISTSTRSAPLQNGEVK